MGGAGPRRHGSNDEHPFTGRPSTRRRIRSSAGDRRPPRRSAHGARQRGAGTLGGTPGPDRAGTAGLGDRSGARGRVGTGRLRRHGRRSRGRGGSVGRHAGDGGSAVRGTDRVRPDRAARGHRRPDGVRGRVDRRRDLGQQRHALGPRSPASPNSSAFSARTAGWSSPCTATCSACRPTRSAGALSVPDSPTSTLTCGRAVVTVPPSTWWPAVRSRASRADSGSAGWRRDHRA